MDQLLIRVDEFLKNYTGERVAAFDLDDTLTDGDTGDAFFLHLKNLECISPLRRDRAGIPMNWESYQKMIVDEGKVKAYSEVVSVMEGIPEREIVKAASSFYTNNKNSISFGGVKLDMPVPNPFMQNLVKELKARDFRILIISASNKYIVDKTAALFFDIPPEDCFAISPVVEFSCNENLLTAELQEPIPITDGKAEIYRMNSSVPPLITAGNSDTDIYLINLVHPEGIPVWCNSDETTFPIMKEQVKSKANFTFMKR